MNDKSEKIRADLDRAQVCLVQTVGDQKFNLQLKTDTYFYGILDIFAEKSSAPQFVYQVGNVCRPMTPLEYRLFIEKLKKDIIQSDDPAFRVFRIEKELGDLWRKYHQNEEFHHICLRDLQAVSKTHDWTIDMYKEEKWHTARLGKTEEQDIFTVGHQPMSGKEFIELRNLADRVFQKKMWDKILSLLFQDRFIDGNYRLIKAQRKNKNKNRDQGHPPRE